MVIFEDIQDAEEWLAPLGFEAFWPEAVPWDLYDTADRAHFERQLSAGVTDPEIMLACLKIEVRLALTERFGLAERIYTPPDAYYLQSTH